ncbi:MAG TPA: PH domain-containing protein [Chloroflexaceae bacterium]|nr:PH domain-containing protein [Chloroflexaceae bacterium]
MSLSDWFRRQLELDAESSIELGTQERILHVTGRHYIVLIGRLIIPVLSLLFFGGFALYRAAGGGLFVSETNEPVGFDLVNWLLAVLLALMGVAWLALMVRGKKTAGPRAALIVAAALVGGLAYLRYNGWRVFFIDPARFANQGLDLWNIGLMFLAALAVGASAFTIYDWLNDELILTNQRVIYDNDQVIIPRLIEQRVQQQIFLEDIQDVAAATKTYPQHLLRYGTIEVKSARFNGNIMFTSAADPMKMQAAIMGQVRAMRKSLSEQNYGRLVGERVYGLKAPGARQAPKTSTSQGWRWLRTIVPANPEVDEATGQYVWRPHWLFLAQALIEPFVVLLVGAILLLIGARLEVDPALLGLAGLALAVYFVARTAWKVEDYRNDLYILTPDKVIDIEKQPFGPEDRREANLAQVNNISSQTTYLSNFLGYGDVVLSTAGGGGSFTFFKVPRPGEVVSLITEYNVRAQRASKDRALNDTLELLKYYHEAQLQRDEINRPPAEPA